MAAGLGFKTFATGDVLTAGDTNGYLMQGVLVFADATARSAAITSPQQGQMSFLKDTNVTQYYSGSAWVTVGGSSSINYQLLSTTTLSGASTRTVSGISGVNSLYIYIDSASSSSGSSGFRLRFNSDTGSNYKQFGIRVPNTNEVSKVNTPSDSSYNLADIGNASGYLSTFVKIDGTNAVGIKPINTVGYGDDTNGENRVLNGIYIGTSAISSVTFYVTAGSFDGGTMYIYGA